MTNKNKDSLGFLTIILILSGLTIIALFIRTLFLTIVIALLLAGVIAGTYYLIRNAKTNHKKKSFENSPAGKIAKHLAWSTQQMDKNLIEIEEIKVNIQDLEENIDSSFEINEIALKEHHRILVGFQNQLQLRQAKIDFFEACNTKLQTLQYNYQLTEQLANKQKRLSELQENHYEDIARMEQLKSDFEYDKSFLDNIEMLSLKMLASNSIDTAKALQLELLEMIKEIKKL